MLGIHDFWLFLVSALLLNIAPGPDSAYVIGRSVQLGWRGGVAAALGISTGCLAHVFAVAIGLSALLVASATAFTAVKWVGAACLCYVGLTMLLSRSKDPDDAPLRETGAIPLSRVFWQGALTDVLNPKVALFFLAFLPQFIDPASNMKIAAFITLGLTFVTTGTIWCLVLAWFASSFSKRLRNNETVAQWLNRTAGAIFVFLGLRLATAK